MYKEVEKMTNSKKMNPQKLKDTLLKYALYIILLLLLVVIVAIKPNFLSVGNLIRAAASDRAVPRLRGHRGRHLRV